MSEKEFTKNAQDTITKAMNIAQDYKHPEVTPEHLLIALLEHLQIAYEDMSEINTEATNIIQGLPKFSGKPTMSQEFSRIILSAESIAQKYKDKYISLDHLILALCQSSAIKVNAFKNRKKSIEEETKKNKKPADTHNSDSPQGKLPSFAVDMVEQAKNGKFDPVIGREEKLRSVIEILSKKEKSNPILIGNPGVGKTAIINALATEIANNKIPTLAGYKIYNVDIGSIVAGTGVRGEFEERFKSIIKEACNEKVIIFIDEIHMLINAGSCSGSIDAANMLKPQLANGDIKCIGATTFYEYRKYIESDPAFARRFVKVDVNEPSVMDSITMLRGLKERIETHHGTQIRDEALVCASKMAKKYVPGRMLPDSAIDLLDTACASAVIATGSEPNEVMKAKGKIWSLGLEKASLEMDMKRKIGDKSQDKTTDDKEVEQIEKRIFQVCNEISKMEESIKNLQEEYTQKKVIMDECKRIRQRIENYNIKYEEAKRIGDSYQAAEINNNIIPTLKEKIQNLQQDLITEIKPYHIAEIVSRWTGVPVNRLTIEENERLLNMNDRIKQRVYGQNEAVDTVVDALLTNRAGLSEPNRPIGSFLFLGPTGVGKTELAKAICYELFDHEKGVVLDMSDYSSEISVTKLIGVSAGYVGYGEGGRLTEPIKNKPYNLVLLDEIDLAHPSVYNVLYQLLDEGRIVDGKGVEVDYSNTVIIMTSNLGYKYIEENNHKQNAENCAIQKFGPALYNRFDAVIHFNNLGGDMMNVILNYELRNTNNRLIEQNVYLELSESVRNKVLEINCNYQFGARPLKKYIQRVFVTSVAKILLMRKDSSKYLIRVNLEGVGLQIGEYFYECSKTY